MYRKNIKISFELLNNTFEIYNGNSFYKCVLKSNENLIDKCIGIFVPTRKAVKHSALKKNEKTKLKK
jgi:ribosomal protein S19